MFGPGVFHRKPCKGLGLCPSGGPFLVPPRKGERKRLKGALSAKPPPLRISPASEETKSVLGHFRRGKCAYLGTMKLRDLAYPLGWPSQEFYDKPRQKYVYKKLFTVLLSCVEWWLQTR